MRKYVAVAHIYCIHPAKKDNIYKKNYKRFGCSILVTRQHNQGRLKVQHFFKRTIEIKLNHFNKPLTLHLTHQE